MSVLSYLNDYGSESEESEEEIVKKPILPPPNLGSVNLVTTEDHIDDPEQHFGRVRSFAHERGNWATFVFVKYPDQEKIIEIVNQVKAVFDLYDCKDIADVHVSLSKTVVLKYHMINTFTSSLKSNLNTVNSFQLSFDSVKIYCNEEKSRTFIALKVDVFTNKVLHRITTQVDSILKEFSLPEFYEDPSFHASILWVNGDRTEELEKVLLASNLDKIIQNLAGESVDIDIIYCKIGNKFYQFALN